MNRWQICKTLFALIFYLSNLYLNCLLIVIINERIPLQEYSLPDIGFEFLPYSHYAVYLIEIYLSFLAITLLILFGTHQIGWQIFRRFCLITGITIFTHSVCSVATQLPISDIRNDCHQRISSNVTNFQFIRELLKRSGQEIFRFGSFSTIMINGQANFCGGNVDILRAIHIILAYQFLTTYFRSNSLPIRLLFERLMFYCCWMAILMIIIARMNYLVNILIAYYICTRTFYIYHTICLNQSFQYSNNGGNMFNRFWWWPLLIFFESNSI